MVAHEHQPQVKRSVSLRLEGGSGIPDLSFEINASGYLKLTYGTHTVSWLTVREV